jgi:phospholipase C
MSFKRIASNTLHLVRAGLVTMAISQFAIGVPLASANPNQTSNDNKTSSPIKHVIVIIGENRSFDHVFATYVPKHGQSVMNLLSEGIINANGTPGRNFYKAEQRAAVDQAPDEFLLSPDKTSFPNHVLPAPLVGGPQTSYITSGKLSDAIASENGLLTSDSSLLLSGGTGLTSKTPDTRISDVSALPTGPFQLTNKSTFSYDDYAASPVHRFYQMWQQLDCSRWHATFENPSGCDAALFPWVETATGAGGSTELNGLPQPTNFSTEYSPSDVTTGEGSTAMGFYNVQNGDVPYFKSLADTYSMSDNFHQSVDGGTGANHIMLGHGDAIWYSDGKGNALPPPHLVKTGGTNADGGAAVLDEVENPNPAVGTNNWYSEDGYGDGSPAAPPTTPYGGGSYTDCANLEQPGVSEIVGYLRSLPRPINPNCQSGHYYLLNNYNPGYFGDGSNASTDTSEFNTVFTIPPSSVRSIGDELLGADVSWKYYGDQFNAYLADKYQINYGAVGSENELGNATITTADEYCTICNPFQYDTSIMSNASVRTAHIQDTINLYSDISGGTLPAVSFVKPSAFVDGHPASSKLDLFEAFTKKIVDEVANSSYANDTAIFITFDEGGGYYDSGYVQPLDYFGDGTRIPLIVVSAFSKGGNITHNYSDHVSILKFIERNWGLGPVTNRSRDNFPNPIALPFNPYVPLNSPAISDLFELFNFPQQDGDGGHGDQGNQGGNGGHY